MSDRLSVCMYWACSGDMYWAFPMSTSPSWFRIRFAAFAIPKSVSFTTPSVEIMMFLGETSRWTTLSRFPLLSAFRCAYSSARQTRLMMNAAMSTGTLRFSSKCRFMNSWRFTPSMNSMAM